MFSVNDMLNSHTQEAPVAQGTVCVDDPGQGAPVPAWEGLSQDLVLVCVPFSQVTEQEPMDQALQPPSTGTDNSTQRTLD